MLEQDGSEDNPLYLEEKEGKILSYYLNVSPINWKRVAILRHLSLLSRTDDIFGFLSHALRLLWES